MPEFAVTAIGRDRPGIVAAISAALLELDGNIEDSQMSILRGHFAVMLIVKLPEARRTQTTSTGALERGPGGARAGGDRRESGRRPRRRRPPAPRT